MTRKLSQTNSYFTELLGFFKKKPQHKKVISSEIFQKCIWNHFYEISLNIGKLKISNSKIRLIEMVVKHHFQFHLSFLINISKHTACLALLRIHFCQLKSFNLFHLQLCVKSITFEFHKVVQNIYIIEYLAMVQRMRNCESAGSKPI